MILDFLLFFLISQLLLHVIWNYVIRCIWNKFQGPRWSHFYPECHVSKPKLICLCPYKCSTWPEMQSANPKHQANTRLSTYFLVPSKPKQGWLCINQIFSICLFFILYFSSYKSFMLPDHFAVLWIETACFVNYQSLFVSLKLSSFNF